ncbi:hypothetical protein VTK26DRAFT_3672 [Humicola hyalothermophila]
MAADISSVLSHLRDPRAPDSAIATAVQTFTSQAEAASSSIGDYLWDSFNTLFEVAGRTAPEHQDRLVKFLTQLRQTEVKVSHNGEPLQYEGGVVWTDMPSFGWVARDRWNFDALDPSASDQEQARWYNWAGLLAQLTALSTDSENGRRDPFDFSLFALWAMRTAFEDRHSEGQNATFAQRQAAVWIRYAGAKLRKLCAKGHELEARVGVAGSKFGERPWKGFSEERWQIWKDGFKAAGIDEVGDVAEMMDKL